MQLSHALNKFSLSSIWNEIHEFQDSGIEIASEEQEKNIYRVLCIVYTK